MSGDWSVSWFVITMDDRSFTMDVSPPGHEPWRERIAWDSVVMVCFEAEGPEVSDGLYVFTSIRPESWVIPVEAVGGLRLLGELVRRGLFDAGLAIEAAQADHGLFCWPPGEPGP